MGISLEQIEALRERAHVTYEEAKEALEKSNGDIVEALIYLEKSNKIKEEKVNSKCASFWEKLTAIVKRGNRTKFVISKKDHIVLNISVTLAVIITLIAHVFVAIGLVIALFTGHRIKFVGKSGENTEINKTLNKVSDFVDNTKENISQDETTN